MDDLNKFWIWQRILAGLLGDEDAVMFDGEGSDPRMPQLHFLLTLPDGQRTDLCAAVKRNLRPSMIPSFKQSIDSWTREGYCTHCALFSDYINESLAEHLREEGIWFLDGAGNAYLEIPNRLLIFVTGKRPKHTASLKGQYFSSTGARILFYLLQSGPAIQATYRDISAAVGVSLDRISKVMNELLDGVVLVRNARAHYDIRDSKRLLDMWTEAFLAKLHPKILLGRYATAFGTDYERLLAQGKKDGVLEDVTVGGEYAGDVLTQYLRASGITFYVSPESASDVQQSLKLAPSQSGPIELCARFANELGAFSQEQGLVIASPILVYAELLATDDPRCGETALRLKEKHLPWIP